MTSETAAREPDIFDCRMCGDCCRGYGGTRVAEADVRRIAEYIGEDPLRFVKEYCRRSGSHRILAQSENGYCIFFDEKCTIHPVKPGMCRAWPFIRAVLVDVSNWHAMASVCPGMRTDLPDDVITACVRKMLPEGDGGGRP